MKYSKQREQILNAVKENRIHPTADMVYARVREENPTISLGTVYRNLNLLSEQGLLRKVEIPNASDRFDGCTDKHYHMICEGCGGVFDVALDVFADLHERVLEQTGFVVTCEDLILKGFCKDCKKKKEQ